MVVYGLLKPEFAKVKKNINNQIAIDHKDYLQQLPF